MMFAPPPSRLNAHDFAVAGSLFCVSHVLIWNFVPPFALVWPMRIFAAASAGLSKGAIYPLLSYAQPMMIGFFAAAPAAFPPAAPAIAAIVPAATRSAARAPHF